MKHFLLYGTSACHLCEEALALLQQVAPQSPDLTWDEVDISEDDALFERYGLTIPVLRHPDGREINWPFSAEDVARFVAS